MRSRSRRRWAIVIVAGLALCMGVSFGRYHAIYICPECGLVRITTQWQIPTVRDATLFNSHKYRTSALSTALDECGLQKDHVHKWMFADGTGNGISCSFGLGRHILVADDRFYLADLLKMAHHHGETALVESMRAALADPRKCQLVEELAGEADPEQIADARLFREWLKKHENEVMAIREAVITPP